MTALLKPAKACRKCGTPFQSKWPGRVCAPCRGQRSKLKYKLGLTRKHQDLVCCQCGGPYRGRKKVGPKRRFCSRACQHRGTFKREGMHLKTLDKLAGALCRAEGGCVAAGQDGIACSSVLNWAHVVSRTYHKIRYYHSNCVTLCAAHHVFYTFHTAHWERFRDLWIGEAAYARLRRIALDPTTMKLDRAAAYTALSDGRWPLEPDTLFDVPAVSADFAQKGVPLITMWDGWKP